MAGLSGTFQMMSVVIPGLILASLFPDGSMVQLAGILFIASQSILSYLVAGVSKLISKDWQRGTAIEGVFSTEVWGHEKIYTLVRKYPRLNVVSAWVVIIFECIFPIVVFVEPQQAMAVLVVGVLFHGFNAVFMGLNGFLVAFPATYPALLYANQFVHQWIL